MIEALTWCDLSGTTGSIESGALVGGRFATDGLSLCRADSLECYDAWERPRAIVSDGAYGVFGFPGDPADHTALPAWYEPHVKQWSAKALPGATLWYWNTEIGWAATHAVLNDYGWRYMNCNVWDKGLGHIAGNVNTHTIRRFPVVTEVCVQYVRELSVAGLTLQQWLLREWKRAGLVLRRANEACGVSDAAARKYFDQGRQWYEPPVAAMERLVQYANTFGQVEGRPYYSLDGRNPVTAEEWIGMRPKFDCPHGVTNVWARRPLRGSERITHRGQAVHPNQKPLDLTARIIAASTDKGDVVWEPFGGLFTTSLAAHSMGRRVFAAEVDPVYFTHGVRRFRVVTRAPAAEE